MNELPRHRAKAPYNFVPLPEKIIERYDSISDLPTHNCSKEGEKALLSGQITFDIKAKTPILVADGNKRDSKKREFMKNAEKQYEIPGSTLKGLVRNNVSVLSLSNWAEQIQEERFYYRNIGESRPTLAKTYKNILGVKSESVGGKTRTYLANVQAGYIVKGKHGYNIYPAKTEDGRHGKSYYVISKYAVSTSQSHRFQENVRRGFRCEDVTFSVNNHGKAVRINGTDTSYRGKILFTGPMQGRTKKKVAYIINEIDQSANPIRISPENLQAYQADYEFRKVKFGRNEAQKEYFKLPDQVGTDYAKPCFYIQLGEKTYFGFTPYLRLLYDQSTKEVLPKHIKDNFGQIDYAKALFGFTNENNTKSGESDGSYASRLSFFSSPIKENPKSPMDPIEVVSGSPRASAVTMYLKQDGKVGPDYKSYNDKDAEIRGMKQYWIKKTPTPKSSEQSNVNSELYFLPEQTTFQATIQFDQLHRDELGLVLWSLIGPTYHQVGMGKPFGYGTVQFENVQCQVTTNERMYQSLTNFFQDDVEKIDPQTFIKEYHQFVLENAGIEVEKQDSVQTFLKMKEVTTLNRSEIDYMDLRNGYSKKLKLPTAEQLLGNRTNNQTNNQSSDQSKKSQKVNPKRNKPSQRKHSKPKSSPTSNRSLTYNPFKDLENQLKNKYKK